MSHAPRPTSRLQKLVFASTNAHKIDEMRAALAGVEIISMHDAGIEGDIAETGTTLEENALIKARYIYTRTGVASFADDTGLEVEALDGAPGVYSARYAANAGAGESHDNAANVRLLLRNLEGQKNRRARFRTVIALVDENGVETLLDGAVEGTIIDAPRGAEGFGYDPIFVPDGSAETFAEMSAEQKNGQSHRGRAARALADALRACDK